MSRNRHNYRKHFLFITLILVLPASAGAWEPLPEPSYPAFAPLTADGLLEWIKLKIATVFAELTLGKDRNPDDNGGQGEDPREMEDEPEGLRAGPCA